MKLLRTWDYFVFAGLAPLGVLQLPRPIVVRAVPAPAIELLVCEPFAEWVIATDMDTVPVSRLRLTVVSMMLGDGATLGLSVDTEDVQAARDLLASDHGAYHLAAALGRVLLAIEADERARA